jgi:o-succinylbenzoate---CoA ligase
MIKFSGKITLNPIPNTLPKHIIGVINEWKSNGSITVDTSGSTGLPKPITLPKDLIVWSAQNTKKALQLKEDEIVLVCLPTTKIGGLMQVMRGLIFGWETCIQSPTANPLLDHSIHHNFSFISLVPYQLASILEDASSTEKLKRFKTILIGGASISQALENRLKGFMDSSETNIYHSYGMTETASHIALRNARTMLPNTFELFPGVSASRSTDDCLMFDIPSIKWDVETKDLGEVEGSIIKFRSRIDDVVNSGGLKLHIGDITRDIDHLLNKHSLAVRYILWKQLDPNLGEKLVFIGLQNSNEKDIVGLLETSLSKMTIPKIFYWVNEFERNESGKIDRQKTVNRLVEVGG